MSRKPKIKDIKIKGCDQNYQNLKFEGGGFEWSARVMRLASCECLLIDTAGHLCHIAHETTGDLILILGHKYLLISFKFNY